MLRFHAQTKLCNDVLTVCKHLNSIDVLFPWYTKTTRLQRIKYMKSAAPGGTKSIKGNCIDLFLAMLIQSVCFLCMTFATRSHTLTLLLSVH